LVVTGSYADSVFYLDEEITFYSIRTPCKDGTSVLGILLLVLTKINESVNVLSN
jgi:hypothetical protein